MIRNGLTILILMLCLMGTQVKAQTRDVSGGSESRDGSGSATSSDSSGSRAGSDDNGSSGAQARRIDAVKLKSGRLEYVVAGPESQAAIAISALTQAGGEVVRTRSLPNLRRHIAIVDLKNAPLARAKEILAASAPQTQIDVHHYYRYAQGKPRVYANEMIGVSAHGGCRLSGVRVGMIDGSVSVDHPVLKPAKIIQHSVLFDGEAAGQAKHGTAVAALMVGEDPLGNLTGGSPGVQLYAAVAFAKDKRGEGTDVEHVAAALDWLLAQNVQLVNMSFAGPPNSALGDLMQAASDRGAILIAAVGNRSSNKAFFPAAAGSVIAVTAVDAAGRRYRKANQGTYVEFAAPGVDLYIADQNGGGYASGTSFASPIVTALAAQAMTRGARSSKDVRATLRSHAQDIGKDGRDKQFGWGLVQATGC